ncbi:MAG: response regulator, partial [Actinobacteria bacterium]|nr:response regulator [Actinomycetota bacterium]
MTQIVIIDDHEVVREGLKAALRTHGYEIAAEAASVAEARAQITHINPDAIIVDINLPDGSGFEIITWARSVSKTIGIVVLTLNETDNYLLAAMNAGASAYVVKSAPIEELIAAINLSLASPLSFSAKGLKAAIKTASTQSY